MDAPIDDDTKRTVQKIPLLSTRAGPRDGADWTVRLKEEYLALIQARDVPDDPAYIFDTLWCRKWTPKLTCSA